MVIEQKFGDVRTGGTGHLHEPPVRAMGEQGAVEGVVDFGELVQAPHSGRKAGHMFDHAREPGEVHVVHKRQGGGHTRAFKDAADFVFVLYFLTGHLADVLPLLRFRRDQAVLREDLQRLADWCAADAEAFGKDDFLNLLAGSEFAVKYATLDELDNLAAVCLAFERVHDFSFEGHMTKRFVRRFAVIGKRVSGEARRIAFSMCFSTELLHSVTEIGATSRC